MKMPEHPDNLDQIDPAIFQNEEHKKLAEKVKEIKSLDELNLLDDNEKVNEEKE